MRAQVSLGRYCTASEVVREGLRLLEEADHRRLVEKWLFEGLSDEELALVLDELKQCTRAHLQGPVDEAIGDVETCRAVDGPGSLERMRRELRDR